LLLVLRKGSGRVLRPCHFLIPPCSSLSGSFKHLICQTVIKKNCRILKYNVVHVLDIRKRTGSAIIKHVMNEQEGTYE